MPPEVTPNMTEHATPDHPGDVEPEPHGSDDHGADHGHDDHAHESEALGPVDVMAWGAFVLGAGLGLAVAFVIALATADLPG
jgi:hypothetical protein